MPTRQWVTVSEAAQKTGYHVDYVRKLASESYESKRPKIIVDRTNGCGAFDVRDHVPSMS